MLDPCHKDGQRTFFVGVAFSAWSALANIVLQQSIECGMFGAFLSVCFLVFISQYLAPSIRFRHLNVHKYIYCDTHTAQTY